MKFLVLAFVFQLFYSNLVAVNRCASLGAKDTSPFRVDREPGVETRESLKQKALLKVDAINRNQYLPLLNQKIAAQYLPEFDSLRLFSEHGLIPEGARFRMLGLHGAATITSNADAMGKLIRYFGDNISKSKGKSIGRLLRQDPNFLLGAVEALELPGHGVGPLAEGFQSQTELTEYLIRYLKMMKSETPQLPIIVWTRSSSAVFIEDVIKKAPGLISGVIPMSGPVPDTHYIKSSAEQLIVRAENGELKLNSEGLTWVLDQMKEAQWRTRTSFPGTPTLILTGSKDVEMMPYERRFYRKLAKQNANIEYHNIVNAEHDFLRGTADYKSAEILAALSITTEFIKDIVDRSPSR